MGRHASVGTAVEGTIDERYASTWPAHEHQLESVAQAIAEAAIQRPLSSVPGLHAEYDRRQGSTVCESDNVSPGFDNKNRSAKIVEGQSGAAPRAKLQYAFSL